VQKHAGVIVYVDPEIQSSIVVSQIECFIKRFAVFAEGSAWPRESIDWVQSFDAILTLRGSCLHYPPQARVFLNYSNVDTKASLKIPADDH
jgi:hypothetical protein